MKKLFLILSGNCLLTIYKTLLGLILIMQIYGKPLFESFKNKLEMVQCNTAHVIIGAIKSVSHDHVYREFGLESLAGRSWSLKILFFHKIIMICHLYIYIHVYRAGKIRCSLMSCTCCAPKVASGRRR